MRLKMYNTFQYVFRRRILEKKEIKLKIISDRYDNTAPLLDALEKGPQAVDKKEVEHEHTEMTTEATLLRAAGKTYIRYNESELSGMEGAATEIWFFDDQPQVVTMERSGGFATSFVFESGKRHICVYNTPIMTFEMGVHAKEVKNRLLTDGFIVLDYMLEIRGAGAERNRVHISII